MYDGLRATKTPERRKESDVNTLLAAHRPAVVSLVSAIVLLLGCDGDGATGEVARDAAPEAAAPDTQSPSRDVAPDVLVEDAPATTSDGGEAPDAGADAAAGDAGSDAALTPALEVPAFSAYVTPPAGSLVPPELASCALYKDEVCRDDTRHVCALYDAGAGDWATGVPPMTEQAFVFDRYYDLYHQAAGQSMDFRFTRPILAGTPEAEWSQPDAFRRYSGYGDASGWTGTALWGAAARYAVTGTAADYDRMLEKLESMALLYQVTGVPGLLARSHWAMLPEGAPEPHGHWRRSIQEFRHTNPGIGLPFSFAVRITISNFVIPNSPKIRVPNQHRFFCVSYAKLLPVELIDKAACSTPFCCRNLSASCFIRLARPFTNRTSAQRCLSMCTCVLTRIVWW